MADNTEKRSTYTLPSSFSMDDVFRKAETVAGHRRSISFDNDKQRNARNLSKGLSKPGYISQETLRRAARSVHIISICKTVLKEKVTKTKWMVGPKDPSIDAKKFKKQIDIVSDLLKKPNVQGDTWRSFLDKSLDDLLTLDAVFWEKTRFPDGQLAELYHVDSASIHPVFNEHGQTNVGLELPTKDGLQTLPVSYLQVLNYSQYGGPESGDIVAAWSQDDAVMFHQHPQGSLEGFGYGLSPIESILSVVSNLLNADNYNGTYFEEGGFPPVILQLVGQMTERDMERYREYLLSELQGHFHRPAIIAGEKEAKAINLKDLTNRDMQFMEYQLWLAKLACAAFGLQPQDIGLTDQVGGKNVADTQKEMSDEKGYSSILNLLEEQINTLISEDYQFEDIVFKFVADDTMSETEISTVVDQRLKNGTMTINEAREKFGDVPFGTWANDPVILMAAGYQVLGSEQIMDPVELKEEQKEMQEKQLDAKSTPDEKPGEKKPFGKSVYTDHYRCFLDDRGFSQPFIYADLVTGKGFVIKPPVAVNLMSQELEVELSKDIEAEGVNVPKVKKVSYSDAVESMPEEVRAQFARYVAMTPEYDSEKWRAKIGGSRKFPYYLVQDFIDGYQLSDQRLIDDMKRDPDSYVEAVEDLAAIWKVEKKLKLGDRRRDQYLVTLGKRGWGFDFQFAGDEDRWERTKDALFTALSPIPELQDLFLKKTGQKASFFKGFIERANKRIKDITMGV